MSDRHELREANGHLLGYRQKGSGGRIEGRDGNGLLKGYYDPATDETRRQDGSLAGRGDLLSSLIAICR